MNRVVVLLLSLIVLIFISRCSSYRKTVNIPEPRPLGENYTTGLASSIQEHHEEYNLSKTDTLTLTEAIQLALLRNPELQSYSIEMRAREARTLQESFAPNPQIEFEVENFGGTEEFEGFNGSEFTLSVGQLIELAGKRKKRTLAAAFQSDLAAWDYEAKKLDVLTETAKRYLQLIGDQEQLVLNEELVSVSEKLHQAVNRLVKAGRISAAELSRTQVLLSTAQLELNRSRRKLEADRSRLSSQWGDTKPGFKSVSGSLDRVEAIPPLDSLGKFLDENPDIVRWTTEIELRQAIESLEEAKQIPDPTIQAGYKYLSEPSINAFIVNLSIPIPVFDNNKGAVQEAFNRRKKAEEQRKYTEIILGTYLIELYQNLAILYAEIDNSTKIIIPEAEKAYQIINDGYLLGKFRFLDVLQSQKTLFESRKNLISSLMAYHLRVADMERLIGRPLASVTKY
jgi:cobalt-zinc-cadmium efflux system outer membrane protein